MSREKREFIYLAFVLDGHGEKIFRDGEVITVQKSVFAESRKAADMYWAEHAEGKGLRLIEFVFSVNEKA